ncbi:BTAD domain-containing putative transcriptional regulator [Nocardia sp. NPDC101769]|uniref:AfsR/SARP family transcriptional regulator n=1 Tax=Nocardia sp. NPDC101769 TaxID=3364333 RepID=UPI00380C1BAD
MRNRPRSDTSPIEAAPRPGPAGRPSRGSTIKSVILFTPKIELVLGHADLCILKRGRHHVRNRGPKRRCRIPRALISYEWGDSSVIRFSILGPLEILQGGVAVRVGGYIHRAVLGYLLINANKTIPVSCLLNAVWGSQPPRTARKMIHNAVSDIRRMLEETVNDESITLETRQPGYRLQVPLEYIDMYNFNIIEREARSALACGQLNIANIKLREALGLWRGSALADLTENGARWPELTAVDNKRLAACEDYFELELARGAHLDVVAELEVLVATAPDRERLGRQYMLALYRSGRQTEALEFYRETRQRLMDTLGIVPGAGMATQYELILNHDPRLQISSTTEVA